VIYGDQTDFPTFEFSPDELQARQRKLAEADLPLHYDASTENRARGAGQYTFSKDEGEREAQMEAIKAVGEAAVRERTEVVERGKKEDSAVEERRRLIMDKKRKLQERREKAESERPSKVAKMEDGVL
jgi:hypothetical protein